MTTPVRAAIPSILGLALATAAAIRKAKCDFWAPFYNAL
jgi:hypothetical protein